MSASDDPILGACVFRPFWLEDAPLCPPAAASPPERADLVVVGSGYTGLAAALQAAEAGLSVTVLDAGPIGAGCSTRNGGQVSSSLKPDLARLTASVGAETARAMEAEGREALAGVPEIARRYGIDAVWRQNGLYRAAHGPRAFAAMEREVAADPSGASRLVARADQAGELGSARYHGGMVVATEGSVQPAKLHAGLVAAAERAGIGLVDTCAALGVARAGPRFAVTTPRGRIEARHVLIATNGYSGTALPWHRRRVVPIGSYMLATAPMDPGRCAALIPHDRTVVDSRKVVIYLRRSPDGRRIVFGGRSSLDETDPARSLPRLHAMMLEVFPQIADVPVSHAWMGFVAYTFDGLPHVGVHDGIHHAMGYCGSGIALSLHLGTRIGQQIAGDPRGRTAFDGRGFATRPFYTGTPWFLKPSIALYRLQDRYRP